MASSITPNGGNKPINLSETSVAYYERMSAVLSDPEAIESASRDNLVRNFLQQVNDDNIVNVALNLKTSEVLENFINVWCDSQDILKLFQQVNGENIHLLAYHKSGSHVLQTIIQRISYFIYQNWSEDVSELVQHFAEFSPFCIDICNDLAFDSYGSHIVRSLLRILCGVYQYSSADKNTTELLRKPEYRIFTPQNEFLHLPKGLLKKFTKSFRLLEAITDIFASPTIISIIEILNEFDSKLSKKFNKKVLKCLMPHFHQIIDHERGSFVIQSLLSTAGESQYAQLLNENIQGSIFKYATCKYANFVIQTLIANAHTDQHFIDILDELDNAERIGNILAFGYFGVVYQIVKTGLDFPTLQKHIESILLQTFNCQQNKHLLIPLLLLMIPSDNALELNRLQDGNIVFQPQDSVHLHGSLIVQTLFSFEKTKIFAKSLLSSSVDGVFKIANDPNGSHVLDKFVASSKVKLKYKHELFSMIETKLVQFACSKYGSRVFDRIWTVSEQAWKVRFINGIAKHELELKGDFFGKFVIRNCKLDLYKRRRSDWENIVEWNVNNELQNTARKRKIEEIEYSEWRGRESSHKKQRDSTHAKLDNLFDQLD